MPTESRLVWTEEGSEGWIGLGVCAPRGGMSARGEGEEEEERFPVVKKEVIWRWAGSLAAPANWRFVRGADMISRVLV